MSSECKIINLAKGKKKKKIIESEQSEQEEKLKGKCQIVPRSWCHSASVLAVPWIEPPIQRVLMVVARGGGGEGPKPNQQGGTFQNDWCLFG